MHLVRSRKDALGDAVAARDHEIVVAQIELLDRERHQEQQLAIEMLHERDLLHEARARSLAAEEAALLVRNKIDERENVRFRVAVDDVLEYAFCSAIDDTPVMYDGYFHSLILLIDMRCPCLFTARAVGWIAAPAFAPGR